MTAATGKRSHVTSSPLAKVRMRLAGAVGANGKETYNFKRM